MEPLEVKAEPLDPTQGETFHGARQNEDGEIRLPGKAAVSDQCCDVAVKEGWEQRLSWRAEGEISGGCNLSCRG